ncbi:hypothetical protein HPU229334_00585 [Helicobacter pullorum]|uniref:Uncharacterized protein n=1 Tax=Helicobacter pullorum TaxID=35818 RepID=A0A0N0LSE4_9HELI|nr:hypothetical protein [Helicobacter pullorum]KPH54668.1 hypothetical protein HPU229334_00585 [Helicobacter pullorum]
MKVKDLIEKLKEFDENLEVGVYRTDLGFNGAFYLDLIIGEFDNRPLFEDEDSEVRINYGKCFLGIG